MEFFNKLKTQYPQILKIGGIALAVLVVLSFLMSISGNTFSGMRFQGINKTADGIAGMGMQNNLKYSSEMAFDSSMMPGKNVAFSSRNAAAMMPIYNEGVNIGNDSESFEVTEYNASIETRQLKNVCASVSALKGLDYVIFENANEYDTSCNFTFKVEKKYRDEILKKIKDLDPKDFTENIRTIKNQIDDYTGEEDILKKKLASVESTLLNAIEAYDEITSVAKSAKDAESLAKIIDSKIRVIESLSQQKINIAEQLDRLGRSKAMELDRLNYAYFNVNIYENKFVDGETLKDSWKNAIQKFVRDTNRIIQDLSINFVLLILLIIQYAIYIFVVIVAMKYGWKIVKKLWEKK